MLTVVYGCGRAEKRSGESDRTPIYIAITPEMEAERFADSLLCVMTLEQKVGELFMPAVYAADDEAALASLRFYRDSLHVGGVLLLRGDTRSAHKIASLMQKGSATGRWVAIDAEWGLGMRLKDAPVFPRNSELPDVGPDSMRRYGREIGRECRQLGINMVMGPVADVARDGASVMARRSFGADPQRVADMASAYILGLQEEGVSAVAKHFPGHGPTSADSHRTLPVVRLSRDSLEKCDLYVFRRVADAGADGIMAGHLAVPALDPTGRPASVSRAMLDTLLRSDIGFEGIVVTDAINMWGASGFDASEALMAGADLIVAPADTRREIRRIIRLVTVGDLPGEAIDRACHRLLRLKRLRRLVSPAPLGVSPDTCE